MAQLNWSTMSFMTQHLMTIASLGFLACSLQLQGCGDSTGSLTVTVDSTNPDPSTTSTTSSSTSPPKTFMKLELGYLSDAKCELPWPAGTAATTATAGRCHLICNASSYCQSVMFDLQSGAVPGTQGRARFWTGKTCRSSGEALLDLTSTMNFLNCTYLTPGSRYIMRMTAITGPGVRIRKYATLTCDESALTGDVEYPLDTCMEITTVALKRSGMLRCAGGQASFHVYSTSTCEGSGTPYPDMDSSFKENTAGSFVGLHGGSDSCTKGDAGTLGWIAYYRVGC